MPLELSQHGIMYESSSTPSTSSSTSSLLSDEALKAYFNYRLVASRILREAIANTKDRKLEYDLMRQLKTGKITFRDQAGEIEAAYFQYLTLKSR